VDGCSNVTVSQRLLGTRNCLSGAGSICRHVSESERERSGGVARDSEVLAEDGRCVTVPEGSQAVLARLSLKGICRV
jgi:hypothetical protein